MLNIPMKLAVALCCSTVCVLSACAPNQDRIDALHREAIVWDTHNDLSYRVLYEGLHISQRLPAGHVDIPRLEEGGVDVQTVALYVENSLYPHPGRCYDQAKDLLTAMRDAIEQNLHRVELARTAADVERIVAAGKIALPLAIEGGHEVHRYE